MLPAAQAGQAQQAGEVSGIATHYVLQGLPNCSYPSPPADGLFAALPPGEYDSAAACGGYLEVHGPDGSVRVEVIDQCPGCGAGHIDLSEAAFSAIASLNQGLIDVTYQPLVNPSLPGPVSLLVKQGSSQYWLALLAMNTGTRWPRSRRTANRAAAGTASSRPASTTGSRSQAPAPGRSP